MNWKKLLISLLAVFAFVEVTGFLFHMVMMKSEYASESFKYILRPKDQLAENMWMIWMADLIWSFIIIRIYLKGFRAKGIVDALKFGVYIGIICGFVNSFKTYALSPFPYVVIAFWFLFHIIQSLAIGLLLWYLFKENTAKKKI